MLKHSNYFDALIGTFVLVCAVVFFSNSFKSANVSKTTGYHLIAKFDNIDGIQIGSDVKISGVTIGQVDSQILDTESYRAKLSLNLNSNIKLPNDSSIKVASEGLLGSKYLAIEPGSEEEILKEGDELIFTQSSVSLEELLGKFIFNSSNKKESESKDETK